MTTRTSTGRPRALASAITLAVAVLLARRALRRGRGRSGGSTASDSERGAAPDEPIAVGTGSVDDEEPRP